MAIEIATAFVQIVPSMKGVGKAIESAFGSASETAGNTAGIKAGNGFAGGFGAKLGVITGIAQSVAGKAIEAFMGLSGEITSASDSAQKFASTLNFAGVSEQQIKRLTASTQDYADKTVYDLNDIRNTTAQLAANGVPNYDKLAEAAGNLNAVAGGSADTFKSVAMVLTQTAGQGKLTTENWNQLSDAIPGASGKIQQALKEAGAYTGNFRDAMADGQITAQEFNDAIMSLGFTDAAVEAATSASTIEGATGNLEAAFVKLGASVLDSVKPAITGGMSWIADGVTNAVPVVQAGIEGLIGWFQRLYSKLEENGAITAFKSAWDTIGDAIMGVVNMVIDWAHMIPPEGLADGIKLVADTLNWFIQHGKELAPIIIGIGTAFAAVKGYQALNSGLQALTGTMNTVTTAAKGISNGIMLMMDLGGPIQMLKQMGSSLSLVKTAQTAWSAATKMATAVQGAFNAVIAANPIGAITGAIAAVVAALVWFFTQTEVGRKAWAAFTSWLTDTWNTIVATAQDLWNGLGEFLANLWATITGTVQSAWDGIAGFFTGLWQTISGGVTGAWTSITTFLSGVWTGISTTATTIFTGIRDFIVNVFTVIGALIVAPLQAIQNGINTVFGWILSFITQQMNSTNTVWSTIWDGDLQRRLHDLHAHQRLHLDRGERDPHRHRRVPQLPQWRLAGRMGRDQGLLHDHMGRHQSVPVEHPRRNQGRLDHRMDRHQHVLHRRVEQDRRVLHADHQRHQDHDRHRPQRDPERVDEHLERGQVRRVHHLERDQRRGVHMHPECEQHHLDRPERHQRRVDERMELGQLVPVEHLARDHVGRVQRHPIRVEHGRPHPRHRARRGQRRGPMAVRHGPSGHPRPHQRHRRRVPVGQEHDQQPRQQPRRLGQERARHPQPVTHLPRRGRQMDTRRHGPGHRQGQRPRRGQHRRSDRHDPHREPEDRHQHARNPIRLPDPHHGGRMAYTIDSSQGEYATKQDIIDAIDQALSSGITLNLSDRGGEVMAGKLAKPMSYELNYLAMRGR